MDRLSDNDVILIHDTMDDEVISIASSRDNNNEDNFGSEMDCNGSDIATDDIEYSSDIASDDVGNGSDIAADDFENSSDIAADDVGNGNDKAEDDDEQPLSEELHPEFLIAKSLLHQQYNNWINNCNVTKEPKRPKRQNSATQKRPNKIKSTPKAIPIHIVASSTDEDSSESYDEKDDNNNVHRNEIKSRRQVVRACRLPPKPKVEGVLEYLSRKNRFDYVEDDLEELRAGIKIWEYKKRKILNITDDSSEKRDVLDVSSIKRSESADDCYLDEEFPSNEFIKPSPITCRGRPKIKPTASSRRRSSRKESIEPPIEFPDKKDWPEGIKEVPTLIVESNLVYGDDFYIRGQPIYAKPRGGRCYTACVKSISESEEMIKITKLDDGVKYEVTLDDLRSGAYRLWLRSYMS